MEAVSFSGDWRSKLSPYQLGEEVITDHRYLLKWRNENVAYGKHTEGTDGNDVLKGDIVFGKDGNDVIHRAVSEGTGLLHGGRGNDYLHGSAGNDELYGAEGNDWLYGGGGNNYLYGGTGNDVFIFDSASTGNSFIMDFNKASKRDALVLTGDIFSSKEEFMLSLNYTGTHLEVKSGGVNITFMNTTLDDISQNSILVV